MHSFRKCDDDVTVFILGIPPLFVKVEAIDGRVEGYDREESGGVGITVLSLNCRVSS
jgi:hypothetical protein